MHCTYCSNNITDNMELYYAYDKVYCTEACRRLSVNKMYFEHKDDLKCRCYSFTQLWLQSFSSYSKLLRKFF